MIGYITDTTRAALEIGKPNKITLEDITYVIRKDKRKGKTYVHVIIQLLRNQEFYFSHSSKRTDLFERRN